MRYAATAAQAATNNVILGKGEIGYVEEGPILKVGNGVDHWNDLDAVGGGSSLTTEQVQDIVGAMVTGNTETGITVDYQDADGTLDFAVTGGYTDESIQDLVGAMVSGNTETNITVTYDDTAGKLNFVASGGTPTEAQVLGITEPSLVPPGSPNAKNDEFDGTTSVTWSNTPATADTVSHNGTVPGSLYLATIQVAKFVGRVQSVPGAYPFTVITRLSMAACLEQYQSAGLVFAPTAPTGSSAVYFAGLKGGTNRGFNRTTSTFDGSFSSENYKPLHGVAVPLYFRVIATSATSFAFAWSTNGLTWTTLESGFNPGFTPGVMGLVVNDESGSSGRGNLAVFDFFRVT